MQSPKIGVKKGRNSSVDFSKKPLPSGHLWKHDIGTKFGSTSDIKNIQSNLIRPVSSSNTITGGSRVLFKQEVSTEIEPAKDTDLLRWFEFLESDNKDKQKADSTVSPRNSVKGKKSSLPNITKYASSRSESNSDPDIRYSPASPSTSKTKKIRMDRVFNFNFWKSHPHKPEKSLSKESWEESDITLAPSEQQLNMIHEDPSPPPSAPIRFVPRIETRSRQARSVPPLTNEKREEVKMRMESLYSFEEILKQLPVPPTAQTPEPPKPALLLRGMSRSLSREFEIEKYEQKRIELPTMHARSHTRQIVETTRIYAKKDISYTIQTANGQEESQGKVNQYLLLHNLGAGAYGRVVLARDETTNYNYACKIISKSRLLKQFRFVPGGEAAAMELIKREVAILKKVSNHSKIISLYEVLDDANEDNLYLFFELCERGPVMEMIVGQKVQPFSEAQARQYFRDIVLGLEFLHHKRIVHLDIKPENLLVTTKGNVLIGDFGISRMMEEKNDKMMVANTSPLFTAPCVINPLKNNAGNDGRRVDIWALGVTLYCFVHGYCPFVDDTIIGVYEKIVNDPVVYSPIISKSLRDLLERMLEKDESRRISIQKIKTHPWVTENGKHPMITTEENCMGEDISVTDEDIERAFKPVQFSVSRVMFFNIRCSTNLESPRR
ncbi:Calcium/calmodulin-dependent protein kinase kinase 1 [Boothiomyces macroporosus]|uniref:Calcium/calmodulin-dependent protein kinase kinase 1 n=1 Tax=Boothiomyces macroporosus TaxID=261099 RepID=A0AAD5UKW5_9FUNG|nr:Calcium/calmodulin-dependent protein kinase kinase 1 [Boothiomyces macroporosus]